MRLNSLHLRVLPLSLPLVIAFLLTSCHEQAPRTPAAVSPVASPIRFREVAKEAGLDPAPGQPPKSPLNILHVTGGGGGFIDYDRDGWLDVVTVGKRVRLFHNERNGRFREVTAASGITVTGALMGCASGDFDNDGWPDLFISGYGVAKLYRNVSGTGRFEDVTARAGFSVPRPDAWATSAGFADLDGDGHLDLVVCRYVEFTPASRQLCGYASAAGGPEVLASCPPLYYEPQLPSVYRNLGNGKFEEVKGALPGAHGSSLGIAFADYDGDGRTDFYIANDGRPGELWHNLGDWHFENAGAPSGTGYNRDGREQAGMGADWGDCDGDGRPDLIVATFQNEPRSLYHNEGNGLFTYASFHAGIGNATLDHLAFGVCFLDADNDGLPDLLFANGHVQDTIERIHPPATYAQTLQLFRNSGSGRFVDAGGSAGEPFTRRITGRALATGDYDNDGREDALVADVDGQPVLLHNESKPNHWIGVRALTRSGRDAIGARITVTAGGRSRVGQSQTCRSYLAACDPRAHFGLGSVSRVDRMLVAWPDGGVTVVATPPINCYVTVRQEQRSDRNR